MYDSLLSHCDDFHLFIFAFDDKCQSFLKSQNYGHITVIPLNEFEDEALLKVKLTRSATEYCWTCASSTILYAIKTFALSNCTYIDADMLFYANPKVLIDEMGENSVLITEHRYTLAYDQTNQSGKYCVQFVTFKNDACGMKVLNWWRNACIAWCYARAEDGKFGDQKYLDDWTTRFEGVHVLQHLGGGLAPWNAQQFAFDFINEKLMGVEHTSNKQFEAIFFHFHALKFYNQDKVLLTGYPYFLSNEVRDIFYKPYIRMLCQKNTDILKINPSIDPNGASAKSLIGAPMVLTHVYFYMVGLFQFAKNVFGRQNIGYKLAQLYYFKTDRFLQ